MATNKHQQVFKYEGNSVLVEFAVERYERGQEISISAVSNRDVLTNEIIPEKKLEDILAVAREKHVLTVAVQAEENQMTREESGNKTWSSSQNSVQPAGYHKLSNICRTHYNGLTEEEKEKFLRDYHLAIEELKSVLKKLNGINLSNEAERNNLDEIKNDIQKIIDSVNNYRKISSP